MSEISETDIEVSMIVEGYENYRGSGNCVKSNSSS